MQTRSNHPPMKKFTGRPFWLSPIASSAALPCKLSYPEHASSLHRPSSLHLQAYEFVHLTPITQHLPRYQVPVRCKHVCPGSDHQHHPPTLNAAWLIPCSLGSHPTSSTCGLSVPPEHSRSALHPPEHLSHCTAAASPRVCVAHDTGLCRAHPPTTEPLCIQHRAQTKSSVSVTRMIQC